MNVLITNICLSNYGGTECYVRDLAFELKKRGFGVEIYSPTHGNVSGDIINAGINVVSNIDDIKNTPDIIHGHHSVAIDAINKFPSVPVVFFSHGIDKFGEPVMHENVVKYVAVSHYIADKMLRPAIDGSKIEIIYNWVDTEKFKQKEIINIRPKRALLFSNTFLSKDVDAIRSACSESNIRLDRAGIHANNNIKNPEDILKNYDIVFAKGKCAIESIATGCATILCDMGKLGFMVSPSNIDYARMYNFGIKNLTRDIRKEFIINEIKKYGRKKCEEVSRYIRDKQSMSIQVDSIISLYKEILHI